MSRIFLIRHGQTEANERHLYCGSTDIGLSEGGLAQLQALHYAVPDAEFITSGMRRTEQTLAALFGSVSHRIDPRFREMDFGAFEMGSYEFLKDDQRYQCWISGDNEENLTPGGESGNGMRRRVLAAFREIETDTVIVTHGGPIVAIMETLFPDEGKNRYQWQPKPGHGYEICGDRYSPIP